MGTFVFNGAQVKLPCTMNGIQTAALLREKGLRTTITVREDRQTHTYAHTYAHTHTHTHTHAHTLTHTLTAALSREKGLRTTITVRKHTHTHLYSLWLC